MNETSALSIVVVLLNLNGSRLQLVGTLSSGYPLAVMGDPPLLTPDDLTISPAGVSRGCRNSRFGTPSKEMSNLASSEESTLANYSN